MHDHADQGGAARPAEPLRAEMFQPLVGSAVRVAGSGITLTLVRVEIGDPGTAMAGLRTPFLLIFEGPPPGDRGRGLLPEGLHDCAFGDGGTTYDIYVAPIRTLAPGRQDYQAVFN